MSEVHRSNVTEFRGGRATFHCWVHCVGTSLPEVEWLKRLPASRVRNDLNLYSNTSLVVGKDHYQSMTSCILYTTFSFLMCIKRFKVVRVDSTTCDALGAVTASKANGKIGSWMLSSHFFFLSFSFSVFPPLANINRTKK